MAGLMAVIRVAVIGDHGLVAEDDRVVDDRVAADVAVAAEDRAAHVASWPIQPFAPDDRTVDDARLVDVGLPADDGVGEDAAAGLDHRALVDEARALELDAFVDPRRRRDTHARAARRQMAAPSSGRP